MRVASLLMIVLLFPLAAAAQISPGKLARAHESLEGMKNCLKCHALGSGPSAQKCLECHKEIQSMVDRKKGLHHRVVTIEKRTCFECHSDHAGRSFQLIHWPEGRDNFGHVSAGWKLTGAHASLKCRHCHQADFVDDDFARAHASIKPSKTYLGLEQDCTGCHADPHAGQFKDDCVACHGDDAWKPATRFDHAHTTFPLRGRHATTECSKCHPGAHDPDGAAIRYAGVAAKSCTSCHTDPHAGRLGSDCATCHGEDAWKPVTAFDHARTAYPLTGKHTSVECAKCHSNLAAGANETTRFAALAHTNCSPCHKDPHDQRFGNDCATCHSTGGWQIVDTAGKSAFDHNRSRFALKGLHTRVACEKCHKTESKTAEIAFDTCNRCHIDRHEGQFVHRATGIACEGCHNEDGFTPSAFTVANHGETRFALAGAHLAQPCVACHPVVEFPSGKSCRRYAIGETTCESCHEDIHAGQFTASSPMKRCEDCHQVSAWRGFDFNHDRDTSYRLEGQHRTVRCDGCHIQVSEDGTNYVRYRGVATSCDACHAGQLLQLGGTQ